MVVVYEESAQGISISRASIVDSATGHFALKVRKGTYFILRNVYESKQDYIELFISISTPWNGHHMTEKDIKKAPTAVPSWYDMVPDSDFIQAVFQRKLPHFVRYYLFFSFKGNCSLFLENNDGTVELSSELDYRAKAEADRLSGYNEDHGSLIYSERVLSQIDELLEE